MIPIIVFDLLAFCNLVAAIVFLVVGDTGHAACAFLVVVVLDVHVVRRKLEQSIKGGGE